MKHDPQVNQRRGEPIGPGPRKKLDDDQWNREWVIGSGLSDRIDGLKWPRVVARDGVGDWRVYPPPHPKTIAQTMDGGGRRPWRWKTKVGSMGVKGDGDSCCARVLANQLVIWPDQSQPEGGWPNSLANKKWFCLRMCLPFLDHFWRLFFLFKWNKLKVSQEWLWDKEEREQYKTEF